MIKNGLLHHVFLTHLKVKEWSLRFLGIARK